MKWKILHESKGRMRLHLNKPRMSLAEADQLQDYLAALPGVRTAAVYERTCDVVVVYTENRASLVKGLAAFRFDVEALAEVPANSPRAVNREYQEKLINMTIFHFARKLFLPMPLRIAYTAVRSLPYNEDGYASVRTACLDTINRFIDFGAIRTGISLSQTQKVQLLQEIGKDVSQTLESAGWYMQITDPGAVIRGQRQSPNCAFYYMDGGSIQKIVMSATAIQ